MSYCKTEWLYSNAFENQTAGLISSRRFLNHPKDLSFPSAFAHTYARARTIPDAQKRRRTYQTTGVDTTDLENDATLEDLLMFETE